MHAAERREIGRVIAMLRSGDRSGALEALRTLRTEPPRRALPQAVAQLPLLPPEMFRFHCDVLSLDLSVGECIDRREDAYRSGKRAGARKHLECQGCVVGQAWRAGLPEYQAREPSNPREVLPAGQRKAKARRTAASWREEDGCDPLAEAASMTPDDPVRVG
jgi:hypothetical protein